MILVSRGHHRPGWLNGPRASVRSSKWPLLLLLRCFHVPPRSLARGSSDCGAHCTVRYFAERSVPIVQHEATARPLNEGSGDDDDGEDDDDCDCDSFRTVGRDLGVDLKNYDKRSLDISRTMF